MPKTAGRYISAGDLEKYSYCPLSWWLSREHEAKGDELTKGVQEHHRLGKVLWRIDSGDKAAAQSEKMVFWYAIVATLMAIAGLEMLPLGAPVEVSHILGAVALIWLLAATFYLFKATTAKLHSQAIEYEKTVLIFAIVAVVVAVNAVAWLFTDVRMAQVLEALSIIWLIAASFFLYRSLATTGIVKTLRDEFRVKGEIKYIDMGDSKVYRSDRYMLAGKPDYVITLEGHTIPVEEKKGRTPQGPLFSHILQLSAYCLLIEESTGAAPPYGLLKYPEHEHQIEYNDDLKKVLLEKLDEMREAERKGEAHRNHDRPGKCRFCSRKDVCPERLT